MIGIWSSNLLTELLDIWYLPYLPENGILDLMHIVYTLFMWVFIGIVSFYVATSHAFGQTSGMFMFPKIIWIDTIMLLFFINKRFMKIKIEYMDAQSHTLYNMSSFTLHLKYIELNKFHTPINENKMWWSTESM